MTGQIGDYALIGDLHTAALVDRNGSIDWMCLPRFDSGAVFAALLGDPEHGHWSISPASRIVSSHRRYRDDTLILETEFRTEDGLVRVVDFMPPRDESPTLVRRVEGIEGRVKMSLELVLRFDYGVLIPWVRTVDRKLWAVGGPDAVWLTSDVELEGKNLTTVGEFEVGAGDSAEFLLVWVPSTQSRPPPDVDSQSLLTDTERFWKSWVSRCDYQGPHRDAVVRSLITLKALTYQPTGGILAAPTTSLPEKLGGGRNWDYRFCWVRDATFTLYSLLSAGYRSEAVAWRDWLLRAAAGHPEQLQILYGPAGERRLPEVELSELPGFRGSRPVRIGNGAADQFQIDIFGELMDAMHQARIHGVEPDPSSWDFQQSLMETLESIWEEPDDGIWEIRGPRRQFTHSKVMAWVAADRAVKGITRFGLHGDLNRWKQLCGDIRSEILQRGYDSDLGAFTQSFGSRNLDASLLMIPLVGFLPATDERVLSTTSVIEARLGEDGLVRRYIEDSDEDLDGLPPGEGFFLPCSFWLADNMWLAGREGEATELFDRLVDLSNDVGLFSEEFDLETGQQLGNFPQAFTHVSMINTAFNISGRPGPGHKRSGS